MVAKHPDTIAAAINAIADQTAHTTPHTASTR
jgi:hypothetical protein